MEIQTNMKAAQKPVDATAISNTEKKPSIELSTFCVIIHLIFVSPMLKTSLC